MWWDLKVKFDQIHTRLQFPGKLVLHENFSCVKLKPHVKGLPMLEFQESYQSFGNRKGGGNQTGMSILENQNSTFSFDSASKFVSFSKNCDNNAQSARL